LRPVAVRLTCTDYRIIEILGLRSKRNNVELPPLLQNDVFQKIISSDV
jgi:hypothetical protein